MKPLESKDPDLFTISVQFLFRICMESSKHSENIGFRTYIFKRNSIDHKHDSLKKLTSPLLHCVLCSAKALKSITRAKKSLCSNAISERFSTIFFNKRMANLKNKFSLIMVLNK
jgi:hypothetical protein